MRGADKRGLQTPRSVFVAFLGLGAFLDLGDVRTDVGQRWTIDLVLAVAALEATAPVQHHAIVEMADADVIPAVGAIGGARATAPERASTANVVAAVVGRLRRPGKLGNLVGIASPLKGVRPLVAPVEVVAPEALDPPGMHVRVLFVLLVGAGGRRAKHQHAQGYSQGPAAPGPESSHAMGPPLRSRGEKEQRSRDPATLLLCSSAPRLLGYYLVKIGLPSCSLPTGLMFGWRLNFSNGRLTPRTEKASARRYDGTWKVGRPWTDATEAGSLGFTCSRAKPWTPPSVTMSSWSTPSPETLKPPTSTGTPLPRMSLYRGDEPGKKTMPSRLSRLFWKNNGLAGLNTPLVRMSRKFVPGLNESKPRTLMKRFAGSRGPICRPVPTTSTEST